jgi:DNA-binding SARP family transcriptional activator
MNVTGRGQQECDCGSSKARELLAFLLLHRDRAHPRERLGSLLWNHVSTSRSKAYLRKAIWQLQGALRPLLGRAAVDEMIRVDGEWIRFDPGADVWLDVAAFETAFEAVRDRPGALLAAEEGRALKKAVGLYTSDLLENWYLDWCLTERERLQDLYLTALDKLARCAEAHGNYGAGIAFGNQILHVDPACEYAHQDLMRLRYLAGDRTGALRQYTRCADALRAEFGVRPSATTQQLYTHIQNDTLPARPAPPDARDARPSPSHEEDPHAGPASLADTATLGDTATLADKEERILALRKELARLQSQIRRELEVVEVALEQQE